MVFVIIGSLVGVIGIVLLIYFLARGCWSKKASIRRIRGRQPKSRRRRDGRIERREPAPPSLGAARATLRQASENYRAQAGSLLPGVQSDIAVSGAVKRELVDMGVGARKVAVRLNPVRLGEPLTPDIRPAARSGFGFEGGDVVILSIGHSVPVKGWDVLLRAFASVRRRDPRAKLLLVGSYAAPHEVPFFRALQQIVAANDLQEQVVFAGHLGDVRAALLAADVFALPSRSEGCSNVLIEALQAGLPCVATRVGHAGEVVIEGANGFLVERQDEAALAAGHRRSLRRHLRGRLPTALHPVLPGDEGVL